MIDKFFEDLSELPFLSLLTDSKIGLEKEALRVDKNGTISLKMHPSIFGSALTNKYMTRGKASFSTPRVPFSTPDKAPSVWQNLKNTAKAFLMQPTCE